MIQALALPIVYFKAVKWNRMIMVALFIAIMLLVCMPALAWFFGGNQWTIGLAGSDASLSIGLTGAGSHMRVTIYDAGHSVAVNFLDATLPVAIAVGVLIGVLIGFTTGNPVAGLIAAVCGILAVYFVNVVIDMM